MEEKKEITIDVINQFLEGNDPMERIVNLEYKYNEDKIKIIYRTANDIKAEKFEGFYPFVWATRRACLKLCNGNKREVSSLMKKYGIGIKKLITSDINGNERPEVADGYIFKFYTYHPMSYQKFLQFFKEAGNPIYSKNKEDEQEGVPISKSDDRQYLIVTPQEQFMISTGKRFFKGYEDYDEILRMIFDLETQGLDPYKDRIEQIGVRFNRPVRYKGNIVNYEKIFTITGNTEKEKDEDEKLKLLAFFQLISYFNPDVITAHNGENFDWNFIIVRSEILGIPVNESTKQFFKGECIRKNNRETVLKLGGEVETFYQTIVPGIVVTDSLHAVRRAQAIDSNMLKANLKYVTKYSKMEKKNRVYVPGDKISTIWNDLSESYAFNDHDGNWYKIDENNPLKEGYELKTGRYIVERYLLDDLWECDKVELRYNMPNFLICKMLPVPFQKCCTMGTAGQWKALLMAWSFENDLAIPPFGESGSFTGGLSRLLSVGYVDNVIKLDYNSLYPSIILTWKVSDAKDLMGVMLNFLEYVLTQREKYKKLKKKAGKEKERIKNILVNFDGTPEEREKLMDQMAVAEREESSNDKKQLPLKILGNSFFGSYGAESLFPWGSKVCAERTTCTGRQSLRLMIYSFNKLGYKPIVGDSFTGDTPLFVKYDNGDIDIKPISEIVDENEIHVDEFGREYDYSTKPFKVLCRSGWHDVEYVYRHKTDKPIYEVSEGLMKVNVTEDHSLFNDKKEKIKPSEINSDTKLEIYDGIIEGNRKAVRKKECVELAKQLVNGEIDRVPRKILNSNIELKSLFYYNVISEGNRNNMSKTALSGLLFLKKCIDFEILYKKL